MTDGGYAVAQDTQPHNPRCELVLAKGFSDDVTPIRCTCHEAVGNLHYSSCDVLAASVAAVTRRMGLPAKCDCGLEDSEAKRCNECGFEDPCGYHYNDCTLLEDGDYIVSRDTGTCYASLSLFQDAERLWRHGEDCSLVTAPKPECTCGGPLKTFDVDVSRISRTTVRATARSREAAEEMALATVFFSKADVVSTEIADSREEIQ